MCPRILLPLLLTLPLLSACSDEPEDFSSQAARHCTQVLNDHLLTEVDPSNVDVLMAIRNDDEPPVEQLDAWRDGVATTLERRESIQASLDDISPDDPAEDEHWQSIVRSFDEDIEFHRGRVALLESHDWDRIKAEFPAGGMPVALPEDAVAALGLNGTDCEWVHGLAMTA